MALYDFQKAFKDFQIFKKTSEDLVIELETKFKEMQVSR